MNRLLGTVLLTVAVSASMVLPAVADEAEVCPGLDSGAVSASGELVTVTVDEPVGELPQRTRHGDLLADHR